MLSDGHAQSVLNDKPFYDTLRAHRLKGRLGAAFNLNYDGNRKVFLLGDALGSYATRRHLFEAVVNMYYNGDKTDESNRFNFFARAALFRHTMAADTLKGESELFPELFLNVLYDEGRGLNYRFNEGLNITLNLYKISWTRLKIGTGIFFEQESWRIFEREFLPALDTLDPEEIKFLQDVLGIDKKGNIQRTNWRWNTYIQMMFRVGEKVNITTIGALQIPFRPPSEGLVDIPVFPASDKRFPRLTGDISITYSATKKLKFTTRFYIQHDQGQISPFAKENVYSFTQGLNFNF